MIPRLLHIILIALLVLPFQNGLAQERLKDTLKIKEVKIQRQLEHIGISLHKIDSLELRQNPGGSLAGLLADHSPVFIKSAAPGSLATISMRGTLASHTQVLWNGIRINSPMLGQVDFSLIPTFFTDQVQIISGPGSVQSGSGGIGGSIDLASRARWGNPFYGSILAGLGSFNTYRLMAEAGGGKQKWHLRFRIFREQSENDFPFLNTANGLFNTVRQENADFEKNGFLAQGFYRPNEHHMLSLHAWVQLNRRNLPPIMSFEGSGREEYQKDDQIRISASWQYSKQGFYSKLTTGTSQNNLDYYLAHQTGGGLLVNYQTSSRSQSWYNNFEGSYQISSKHSLKTRINGDYHQVEIEDLKTGSGYTAERLEIGLQLKAEQDWSNRLRTYALVQQDWVNRSRNPLVPVIGGSFIILPDLLELNSSLGKNFHPPSLNDLHWVPGGNSDLLPEEGFLGDLGFRSMFEGDSAWKMEIGVTGFISYIENWILWRPGEFRYWTPDNLASVLARGIESSLRASVILGKNKVDFRVNYTLTRTNPINMPGFSSHQLMYIPVHKASLLLHLKRAFWYFNYRFSFASERFTSTDEEQSLHQLPAYSLHHLTLGRELSIRDLRSDIRIQVHNLFDTDYQTILWRAMPGRYFSLSLKIDF